MTHRWEPYYGQSEGEMVGSRDVETVTLALSFPCMLESYVLNC